MPDNSPEIAASQRTRLLRAGIVLLEDRLDGAKPSVVVAGAGEERLRLAIADELGAGVDVEIAGEVPRRLMPRRCVGHMKRDERRLQVRFVLRGDEHVDDIVVAEDDACVVVYGIVCTSVAGTGSDAYEGPWHVYLDRPLGDRTLIDGVTGSPVPYRNVFAELARDSGEALRRRSAHSRRSGAE
jgi:hypothetical protein